MYKFRDAIPATVAHRFEVMPVGEENGKLVLAMEDPENILKLDALARVLAREIIPLKTSREKILTAVNRCYGVGADVLDQLIL